ncbi:MAG: transglutaminase-like domain-containing protein, partial [Pseudomonadota bacterium]
KLSDSIIVRVKTPLSVPLPIYLHEASYTDFNLGTWRTANAPMIVVDPLPATTIWEIGSETPKQSRRMEITTRHVRDTTVQVMPLHVTKIEGDELIEVQKSQLGTVMLEAIPGQLRYQVEYSADKNWGNSDLSLPTAQDSIVPANYQSALKSIMQEFQLQGGTEQDTVNRVNRFFSENFRYSLVGKNDYPGKKPLISFLQNSRSGHCEYFASATALLLRQAQIPTRYSVGYVVDEYSELENAFVARSRHAHAWVSAYIDGRWQTVDNTPSQWLALEQANVSHWQKINDLISWLGLHVKRLQRAERSSFNARIIWLVPILALVLMWRLRNRIQYRSERKTAENFTNKTEKPQGLLRLIHWLKNSGHQVPAGRTIADALNAHFSQTSRAATIKRLVQLHYTHRFSPQALTREEQIELDEGVKLILSAMETSARDEPMP